MDLNRSLNERDRITANTGQRTDRVDAGRVGADRAIAQMRMEIGKNAVNGRVVRHYRLYPR